MDIDNIVTIIASLTASIIASSGFWLYVDKRRERTSLQTKLLIGLAHDRIRYLAMNYIHRGWISEDEYEDLNQYLYMPYDKLGGNGSAKRIMAEIDKLPIRKNGLIDKSNTGEN